MENSFKNLLFTSELVKVMSLLEDNDIQAFSYKGPVLAQKAYGDIACREFGDIDIFIDKANVLTAKELMLSNGYYLDPPITVEDDIYMKLDSEFRFKSPSGALIELNWAFAGPHFYFPQDPQLLFDDFEDIEINHFKIKTPSLENEFLLMVIHCAKHNWKRLSWICDMGAFLENKKLDWDEIWDKANKLGVKRIVSVTLIILKILFRLKVPELKEKDDHAAILAQDIIYRKFMENKDSWNLIEKFFLDLRKRDSKTYGLKDCLMGMSKPSYDDYLEIRLPSSLFSFYLFIRPLLLLKKYGKGEV